MSNTRTQIKGTVVLNSDAGANLTIGNSTATNSITGITNINTTGTSNTTIGNSTVGGITTLASDIISMKSTTSATGKIDIMAGDSSTGSVNILSGTFATGIIDIGGDSTTTNIKGDSVNIETTDDSSSTVNIMTGLDAVGTFNVGGISTTNSIKGTININTDVTDSGIITIGNNTVGSTVLNSDAITIGNSGTLTTMNATNIKQNMSIPGGFVIEKVIGNSNSVSSMSTTFNRKVTSSLLAQACYTIASGTTDQFTAQYFELIVSGANNNRGSYTFRCFFGIDKRGASNPVATAVTTVLYQGSNGVAPTVSFTTTQTTVTLSVITAPGSSSSDQAFITTLISYPTCSIRGSISPQPLEDFIITAI